MSNETGNVKIKQTGKRGTGSEKKNQDEKNHPVVADETFAFDIITLMAPTASHELLQRVFRSTIA